MTVLRNVEADLARFRSRIFVLSLVVLVCFLLLIARLVYLQVWRHEELRAQAENNRTSIVPIVPNRGLILDRNGIVLASNYSAYTLEITPSKSGPLEEVLDNLSQVLDITPRDRRRFKKLLEESRSFESLPIRTRLSDNEVARFAAQRYRFPGVEIKARLFRSYPFGEVASHVIGYIGRINQSEKEKIDEGDDPDNYRGTEYMGKLGIEQSYEAELHGVTGVEEIETSAGGRAMRKLASNPATPGNTVKLSIDIKLQHLIETMFGERRGALVAMDPKTGEVLAQIDFASIHSYSMLDAEYSNFADTDAWPDWDWRQTGVTDLSKRAAAMMDAAIAKTQKDYALARAYLDAKGKAALPIIIGETGWKAVDSSGSGKYKFFANPANQKMYYDRLMSWVDATKNAAGPKSAIYFEAFDEPWKAGDDKWGLFNVGRQARYVIQAKNANNLVLNAGATWVYEYKTGSVPYTESDALYYVAPTLKTAVANNFYTLYADVAKTSETLALANTPDLRWDAFGGNTAVGTFVASASAPADPVNSLQITPAPASYGWGFLFHSTSDSNENLSGFDTASGRLHFSIKTAYAGALEIGLSTDTDDRSGAEAYLRLTNGSYGYCNTNAWCDVSIPLSAFKAANPAIDLRYVLSRFIVADRFSSTGQTSQTTVLNIDNIYYSK